MSELITQIFEFKLPAWLTVLLLSLAIVLTSPVILKLIEIKALNPFKKISKRNLLAHPLFEYLNYATYFRVKSLDFGDNLKNSIFHDMLIVMFNQYIKDIKAFIEQNKFDANNTDFRTKTTCLLSNISLAYIREWYNLQIPKPYYVIELYQRMNSKSYNITYTNILRIYESSIYDSDYERFDAILTILNCYCENLIIDAETTIRQINGQLKDEFYNPRY